VVGWPNGNSSATRPLKPRKWETDVMAGFAGAHG
jgi:hypothetical protein